MTDSTNDPQNNDDTPGNLDEDWAAAMSEQQAGTPSNQAQGLATPAPDDPVNDQDDSSPAGDSDSISNDDWASALAEQTAAQATPDTPDAAAATQTGTQVTTTGPAPDLFKPLTAESVDEQSDIDMIMDIPVQMSVELGRTRLTIKNILQLGQGSVIELDGLAGEPMDIYVNGYLIAQGEVVVVDDKYGIRVTDIITPSDRINRLNSRR